MFDFFARKFSSAFARITGNSHLTEKNIEESLRKVKDALLEADVPYELVETFADSIKKEVVGHKVLSSLKPGEQFIKIVHERLLHFLGGQNNVPFSFPLPSVVLVMGLQGSGKTTTLGKLARYVQKDAEKRGKKRRILLASVDFYRPAAIDQLEILAKTVGVDFYRATNANPVLAAQEIHKYYQKQGYELLLLDTAGRLHVDEQMMAEIVAIEKNLKPRYRLLVVDAMTGQESLKVAQTFKDKVGFDGAILSKVDSGAKGGAAFAFRYALQKPIEFVGVGEKVDDLERFHPDRMADQMLDMGDIKSLIEKAEAKISESESQKAYDSMMSGNMNLQDFADQMAMVNRLGSMSQLMKYIPGMSGAQLTPEMIEQSEKEIKRFGAILSSMTSKERLFPKILNGSRKERIARGAGVAVADVNALLKRFEESQQYAKLFKKLDRFKKFF